MRGEPIDFEGEYFRIRNDGPLDIPAVQSPYPPLYLGGASEAAIEVAAEHVDHYLTWAEPPSSTGAQIALARVAALRLGRSLKFGMRVHLIVRETAAQAWAAADRLISKVDDPQIEAARLARERRSQSEGQRRQTSLHGFRREALEVSPNLWVGMGLVREGAGAALVGDPETVAARIAEYQALGVETFITSGYPHLEEAFTVAELLFPALGLGSSASTGLRRDREFGASTISAG